MQMRLNGAPWLDSKPGQAACERAIMLSHDRAGLAFAIDAATTKREDVRTLLPTIAAATLVICGDLDLATPPELSQEIVAGIPRAELQILAGIRHCPSLEAPQQVAAALAKFVS
jgi:3-oxoadipate enol-lactonase